MGADMHRHSASEGKLVYKNLLSLSCGFVFLFTSYISIENLQSTLNKTDGLGTGSVAIMYGAFVISCISLPPLLISLFGCKWTMAISMVPYTLYAIANLFAQWSVLAPASVLVGIGAAPLWAAQSTYVTELSTRRAKVTNEKQCVVLSNYFGIFYLIFWTCQIWGNLISSTILSTTPGNITEDDLKQCGAAFCPVAQEANNTNLDRPSDQKVHTLVGIYIGCAFLAFLVIAVFLDKIKLGKQKERNEQNKKAMLRPSLPKLHPHLAPVGIDRSMNFLTINFQKTIQSYIACANGIWNVGYVMICYGVVDAICSFTFGRLVQYVGHIFFFVLAGLVHLGVQITLLLWSPHPDAFVVFFIITALWGVGDAVWQTQINALYGSLFTHNPEAAFANYRMWESVGFIIAFAYSSFLCTNVKIYICMGVLITGLLGYFVVEVLERRSLSLDPSVEDNDGKGNGAPRKEVAEGLADLKRREAEGQVATQF